MSVLQRHARSLALVGRWMLAWFVLSLGVAVASPIVSPKAMQIVCSAAGAAKVVVQTDDGAKELGTSQNHDGMHCPLCMPAGAPPPVMPTIEAPTVQPLADAVQPIPAAHIAAATAAPPPARGPPAFS